jgi:predicted TPR repeat methyltransferase
VVSAAAAALRPGGAIVFTVERAVDEVADFKLEKHGRYTHAQTYVEGLLEREGLRPEIAHAELRMESGSPVAGLVVRARKPGVAR